MCWRHHLKIAVLAWGSLFDLTGRMFARGARVLRSEIATCDRCAVVTDKKMEKMK